jgi:hypothetical protein
MSATAEVKWNTAKLLEEMKQKYNTKTAGRNRQEAYRKKPKVFPNHCSGHIQE